MYNVQDYSGVYNSVAYNNNVLKRTIHTNNLSHTILAIQS